MDGFESCTIKKAEHWRIDAFKLWCWRRLLRVLWTAYRSNYSILKKQPWVSIERNDAKAETLVLWPPEVKSWLAGKHPDAEKDWRQKEKGTTEDEIVGWHHWLNAHEFEQTRGDSGGQGRLERRSPWVTKSLTAFSGRQHCLPDNNNMLL